MIIKSMSRKEASFGQLMDYIDRDGGEERSRIRHNLISRDRERIRAEFEQNAEHMQSRKNGVFMYHEIISITRARGIDLEAQKQRLHEIAQEYVAARAPRNLCYGGLHDDKDHSLHYHLMISANRAGEAKRHRLSKEQFRTIQISLERYVLETYPELEQKVAIDKTAEARIPKAETELKRRGGTATERESVASRIEAALEQSSDRLSLLRQLEARGLELYIRGQNIGVIDRESGKRHRVRTLSDELPELLQARMTAKPEAAPRRQADETKREAEPEVRSEPSRKPGQKKPEPEPKREEAPQAKRGPASEKEKGPQAKARPESKTERPSESETQKRWREDAERQRAREKQQDRERDDDFER